MVVFVEVIPQHGRGGGSKYRKFIMWVWWHTCFVGRLSGYVCDSGGLFLAELASSSLPIFSASDSGDLVICKCTVPHISHCHGCVGLRDVEPLQVLRRWVENCVLEVTFGGVMAEHLADVAVKASHIVIVSILKGAGVNLNDVVSAVLVVGARGGEAPRARELVGV